ncbi:lycopene cyclase domain-containing protein [Sphingobacterium oryzagri]|uniref:Lycopene cyclase domain-containing protein n=1 Tax=Sphingobacterium oryzagri TaxID=3025669 RepID=A0ABY7WKB8_9SPHI|nr:lycopene cyclase domain-containing protein [Sphingobacterium sp. KACC 22765]WDF70038.1 lycopene cyclase domain-containing protein [Sphingobacterium sp. KACC 22765]
MQAYTYLLINFLTIIICFVFSFHQKIRFDRYFGAFIKAAVLVAIPFIAWDVWFTQQGVWWFNDRYLLGLRLFGLPLEEMLFFICIPFSCLFTYYCLTKFYNLAWAATTEKIFALTAIVLCVIMGGLSLGMIYPTVTFFMTAGSLFYFVFIAKVRWLGTATSVYGILLIGFFLVNGVLTGTGLEEAVVNYNPDAFWNIRILTVPFEDAIYGYSMILWNIYFFSLFKPQENEATDEMPKQGISSIFKADKPFSR